jgi:hypothetical protein
MRNYRLSRPPQLLRRSTVHLDNVALVPASLLPFKAEWQAVANDLSKGEILIVLPHPNKQRRIAHSVATWLKAQGHRVTVTDSVGFLAAP